jgi:PAS domain S-box-containing protein
MLYLRHMNENQAQLQLFRALLDQSNDAIEVLDPQTLRFLDVNERACQDLGYSRQELLNLGIYDIDPFVDQSMVAKVQQRLSKSGCWVMETRHRRKDGSVFPVEVSIRLVQLDRAYIVTVARDITQRKQADEAIRESEQRFRLVADTAPVMIWMSGPDRRSTYFNRLWLDFTGLSETQLHTGLADIVHPDDYLKCRETYCRGFDERRPFRKECRLRRHDGEYRWMVDIGVPRFQEDGSFTGYIGSCVDITEQKLAEEARSQMSQKLIEAQDQERRSVARELHDDICQRISLLAVNLKSLQQNLPSSRAALQERLAGEYALVSELASDIDALSRRLHSSTLQRLGLTKTAAAFCREFSQRQDLQIEFSSEGAPEEIPEATSFCLFRVLQEALHNAAKHSGAKRIDVQLAEKPDGIHLIVSDSGKGFNIEEAKRSPGLGLTSMQERVRMVGGTIAIDSKPLAGTTIHVCVPAGAAYNSQKPQA